MAQLRIALVQTNPQDNLENNVTRAFALVRQAAVAGARVVVLPEVFAYMGSNAGRVATASPWGEGVFARLSALARELGVFLVGGSHNERPSDAPVGTTPTQQDEAGKVYNTCGVFDPQGASLCRYRKMHLFNLWGLQGEKLFCESDVFLEGHSVGECTLDVDEHAWRANISICYDLRFPEIFRQSGSPYDVLFLPAAFVHETGERHWEILLRARAIENQCFVVACNQTGTFLGGRKRNYGHSMVVDPWGNVLAALGEEEGILHTTLDTALLEASRTRLSALKNRRL